MQRTVRTPDGRTLAAGSSDGTIRLWDVASGEEKRPLEGQTSAVYSVAFAPDGRTAVVTVHDGDAVEAGQPLLVMEAMKMDTELKA